MPSRAMRLLFFLFGVASYGLFFVSLMYAVPFLANLRRVGNLAIPAIPWTVDLGGAVASWPEALAIDTALLLLFSVHHSVAARPGFKRLLTRVVPVRIERSTYVLVSSLLIDLVWWQWRPIPGFIWAIPEGAGRGFFWGAFAAGWVCLVGSSFALNHFDLFGLRQAVLNLLGRPYTELPFGTPGPYRLVRHPIMSGFILAFWASPVMTVGHALFSSLMTAYILIGVHFEERDLVAHLGSPYEEYRRRVPALLPFGCRQAGNR